MANKYTKEEIRTYFETHRDDVKDVSAKFEVSQRTLYHWIKIEEWKQGKYANAGKETVQSDLVQTAIGSRLDYAKKRLSMKSKAVLMKAVRYLVVILFKLEQMKFCLKL
ncbi:hypothetical protein [Campylobacter hyointestinalis]|uniref:Transposase Synechocystis PCC 6803 domain-containing protein n=1 Tax=Campylobacter hyointestinalis subsp. hyointestinalis TaxID=91352 RepID=A0A9W5ESU2_CAMHY|nr:hypothetical protein [Campylobacter hyointestinalis]CUU74674.1 Uncharacterised protein [Campylobacter hyointestinalis subsp. hyointestinalis]CUU82495.1 Uncharacterised protein [Campylobacter hyointestinalis subsp. hyointestinalis]